MKANVSPWLICLVQIVGSVLLSLLFVYLVYWVTPSPFNIFDWRTNLATLMAVPICGYIAFRLGTHYGTLRHRLPRFWWLRLGGILVTLASYWLCIMWGALDLPFRLIALASDYWIPGNFSDHGNLTWPLLVLKFAAFCLALALVRHLVFFKIPSPKLP
ncbi:MAG: hypothetical protein V4599_12130 [Verrucomicrobiota bacterium]